MPEKNDATVYDSLNPPWHTAPPHASVLIDKLI